MGSDPAQSERRRLRPAALACACLAALLAIAAAPAAAARAVPGADPVIAGQYIVVLADSARSVAAATERRERRLGFRSRHRYRHALRGFSARLSPGQVRSLRADPGVELVVEDRRVRAAAEVPLAPGEPLPPTGVRRIGAASETGARRASTTQVAVLDTGIDLGHPDLEARNGTNCISPGLAARDGDGHGTHVAGTIGAGNNGFGVLGVAPGTTLYAVKVLDDAGDGTTSSVVCGIDWVTANHRSLGIGVANMSLSGVGSPLGACGATIDPMHRAICRSTAEGVSHVAAAGNDGRGFDSQTVPEVPAAYPEVLTVTAISDSDGRPGALGGPASCPPDAGGPDDAAAPFSNFAVTAAGRAHTIAAPGVCIESTWTASGYETSSGTSMASPHVAGVVALCIGEAGGEGACADLSPEQVIAHLLADAERHAAANPGYGFEGDPGSPLGGRHYGWLTRAPPPPPANLSAPALSGSARVGKTLTASTGGWEGEPPLRFSYAWRRCRTNGVACADIPGASGSSYRLRAADVGRRVRAVVTARNAGGRASAASPPSSRVASAARSSRLRVGRARIAGGRLLVAGSLARAAAGERIVVRFAARGRRTAWRGRVRSSGRFRVSRPLRGGHRDARSGWIRVRFGGNELLRASGVRLRAAGRPVRLRLAPGAPRLRGRRLVVAGAVRAAVGGRLRIRIEFNWPGGAPAAITVRPRVGRRGRFRMRRRVLPAVRELGAQVSVAHPGGGRWHGQLVGGAVRP